MVKNDTVILDIVDMNNLGAGIGKMTDGTVVFVNGAVIGDRVEARIIKVGKSFCVARTERLIVSSKDRADVEFCSAPQSCGGCVYRNVTRECELEIKRSYIKGAFKKVGLDDIEILPTESVSERTGYRNKAQYPIRATKNGMVAGFFAKKTHTVVSTEHCSLEPRIFTDIVNAVCRFADENGISAYDEEHGRGLLRHIYLRRGEISGEVMLCLVINGDELPQEKLFAELMKDSFPSITSIMLNINKKKTNVVTSDRYITLFGNGYIEDELCGLHLRITPASFWQVNRSGAERLYAFARAVAELNGSESVLDLYCGIGSIGLSMASYVKHVTGVEIVESAVECAKINADMNGIKNVDFYCADASSVESIIPLDREYDVVILDPPRKGTTEELIRHIAARGIRRVVYVSCAPDTLARDIAEFGKYGYYAGAVRPVDMFPATGHIESVVLLSR